MGQENCIEIGFIGLMTFSNQQVCLDWGYVVLNPMYQTMVTNIQTTFCF